MPTDIESAEDLNERAETARTFRTEQLSLWEGALRGIGDTAIRRATMIEHAIELSESLIKQLKLRLDNAASFGDTSASIKWTALSDQQLDICTDATALAVKSFSERGYEVRNRITDNSFTDRDDHHDATEWYGELSVSFALPLPRQV